MSPAGLEVAVQLTFSGENAGEQGLLCFRIVGVPGSIPMGGATLVRLGWFCFRLREVIDVWKSSKNSGLQCSFLKNALSL